MAKRKAPGKKLERKPVRLSQCMIVKNEQRNIKRALSWAKGVAFEQIVVDTGSTDRTVEIAEAMGAKVYHFEWINDFAAAKNYAIGQASGDWIAFLDADEYLPEGDAQKLMLLLEALEENRKNMPNAALIMTPCVQLDDDGNIFAVLDQIRVFRNRPDLRYTGKIHEALPPLTSLSSLIKFADISIMHTGYSALARQETNKAQRNLDLLRSELKDRPGDAALMAYLADSLLTLYTEEAVREAEELYEKALDSGQILPPYSLYKAYGQLILKYSDTDPDAAAALCKRAIAALPDTPDFLQMLGGILFDQGDYAAAWDAFVECEAVLSRASLLTLSVLPAEPVRLFKLMMATAAHLGNLEHTIRYATLTLRETKDDTEVLQHYLAALLLDPATAVGDVVMLLGKLYDFTSIQDKLLLVRTAKDIGAIGLAQRIMAMITPEEVNG